MSAIKRCRNRVGRRCIIPMKYVDSLLGGRRVVGLGGSRGLAWVGRGAVLVEEGSIVEIEVEEAVVPCSWERI